MNREETLENKLARIWTIDQCLLGLDMECPEDDPPKCPSCRARDLGDKFDKIEEYLEERLETHEQTKSNFDMFTDSGVVNTESARAGVLKSLQQFIEGL